MTITKEVTHEELNQKMKDMFPTPEEYDAIHDQMRKELYGTTEDIKKVEPEPTEDETELEKFLEGKERQRKQ